LLNAFVNVREAAKLSLLTLALEMTETGSSLGSLEESGLPPAFVLTELERISSSLLAISSRIRQAAGASGSNSSAAPTAKAKKKTK
jgi:hypothetical protein